MISLVFKNWQLFKSSRIGHFLKFIYNFFLRNSLSKNEPEIKNEEISNYFINKRGLEIGGPSPIFKKRIPIYQVLNTLDGCNFSSQTIWEGKLAEGKNYSFLNGKKGFQYILEASDLHNIPDGKYDFIISSHCLEHCANALKTLKEWLRVLKPEGIILLILPDPKFTFDHRRPITTFEHLLEDYILDTSEKDLSHLPEILELHDLSMDIAAGSKSNFKKRSHYNFYNRCLHHHVFDFDLIEQMFGYFNVHVEKKNFLKPHHQVILGIKE